MAQTTEKPQLAWKLVLLTTLAMGLGGGLAAAAGYGPGALAAAIAALVVAISALLSQQEIPWKAALIASAGTFTMLLLVDVTAGDPIASAAAMGTVAFFGAIVAAGGSAFAAGGSLISMAYFLPAATSSTHGLSISQAVALGLIGVAAGLIVTALVVVTRALRASPQAAPAQKQPPEAAAEPPIAAIRGALVQRDNTFRYALRRAVALGIAMGIFQINSNHNVFWIMLTMFIVLEPDRSSSWQKALQRSGGVILGAFAIRALSEVLPVNVMVGLSAVVLVIGLLYYQRNYAIYAAGISFTVITMFGAKNADFTGWAVTRVTDTVIGALIALAVGYLFLPDSDRHQHVV